jgi:hypothetical protein
MSSTAPHQLAKSSCPVQSSRTAEPFAFTKPAFAAV